MYRGFNLKISKYDEIAQSCYYEKGMSLLVGQKENIKNLKEYIDNDDGILNSSLIEKDWFPSINSHIFISHSHKNEKIAVSLAGYLNEKFGLECFIDSIIWGYSNDLLKEIDKKYCLLENKKTYDYDKRNNSTSHIHTILSMALLKMIDKTECLFFLNTPESIPIEDTINNKSFTSSPWIYSEIKFSEIVRKKKSENRPLYKYNSSNFSQDSSENNSGVELRMKYSVGTKHLVSLSADDIESIPTSLKEPYAVLDYLYSNTYTKFLQQINN